MIITGSLALTVLYAFTNKMRLQDANVWLSGQYISLFFDVIIFPMLKIGLSTLFVFICCPSKIQYYPNVFALTKHHEPAKVDPDILLKNLIKLPEDVKNSDEARMAKISGRQQQEMITSVWKLFVTVIKVAAFNVIVQSIIPNEKYLLDQGFRRQTNYFDKDNQVNDIYKIWSVLLDNEEQTSSWSKIPKMNFPLVNYNNATLSAFEKQTASDRIHFRVGPSR